ncbi:MAG: GtrA family protein [Actinomycetota bacterium]
MISRSRLKRGGIRFSKFSVVGLLNAAVDVGTLNALLLLAHTRDPSIMALYNGVALVLANVNSYLWNTRWTFRGRSEPGHRQRVLFVLVAAANMAMSNGLFWMLVRPVLVHTDISAYLAGNVAKLISVVVASTVTFFLLRYLVFTRKRRWFGGRL